MSFDGDFYAHPARFIRDELKLAGYTITSAAAAMLIDRAILNDALKERAPISRDLAYRLDALLNSAGTDDLARLLIEWQARNDWRVEAQSRHAIRAAIRGAKPAQKPP
jgi:plasmid maintenance system antidote protein VapI